MDKAIFLVKGSILIKVLVKALETVEVGGKLPFLFLFIFSLAKLNLFKDSFNTTMYLSNSLSKINQLQESEMKPTDWTLS